MKEGDKVETPDGPGVIVGKETNRVMERYGVKLDDNKRYFNAQWYFKNEITTLTFDERKKKQK